MFGKRFSLTAAVFALAFLLPSLGFSAGSHNFDGKWKLIPNKSSEISLYRNLSLEIHQKGSRVTLIQKWGTRRFFADTLVLKTGGKVNKIKIKNRVFPTNVFMGLRMAVGKNRKIKAFWEKNGKVLRLEMTYPLLSSQGGTEVSATHILALTSDAHVMTYTVRRSTRDATPPIIYVLKKDRYREAYVMHLADNWEVKGGLDQQAFLISLQGLANTTAPRLYFIYPKDWPVTFTPLIYNFLQKHMNFTFKELKTPEQALQTLKPFVKGYVIWDPNVRTSLIVAFTVAGLERAVVVDEKMIPLVEKAGLKKVADFRGKFTGQTDYQIYKWAYQKYWKRCNKDLVLWMGGDAGKIMKPGMADWGISMKTFFTDLSTRKTDTLEYSLADKILSEMHPLSMVMGWHSYAKDLEREFVTLVSSHGFAVEGLNTTPNQSFMYRIPPTPGFKYKNNGHVVPGKKYIPENKVYITCVQSDGIGLGAWTKPGRGEIPYTWEISLQKYLPSALLEYFYTDATPNDYFIGALSGPGYIYPKAVPPKLLPGLLREADKKMQQLDLQYFDVMDYSEGATVEGNTELTKQVVNAYYKYMPHAQGFLNGYAPAFTFAIKDKRPFISFDYYLSPTRDENAAVADIEELSTINAKRPYFLLLHVRESSDIKRVQRILNKLKTKIDYELVPLDIFMKMAGEKPTFKQCFLKK